MPFFEQAPLLLATKKINVKSIGRVDTSGSVKVTEIDLDSSAEKTTTDIRAEKDQEPIVELDSSGRTKVPAAECDRRVEACRSLARKIIKR